MPLPLPKRQAALLTREPNLSLHFDRGYGGYDAKWGHIKADPKKQVVEGKTSFMDAFVRRFNDPHEYRPFLDRRDAALKARRATSVDLTSSAPLVVGLGRWHPTELGFNLDRFTACPFIPGSTVKGLLREAARLVSGGELPDPAADAAYWRTNLTGIFGRGTENGGGNEDDAGSVAFFDAYPITWPKLELDVMTPHYGAYYGGGKESVAADWEDPVPVHFLRVSPRVAFRFWFGSAQRASLDEPQTRQLATLLRIALDWLGVGAKKSSGYGWFGDLAALGVTAPGGEETTKRPNPPEEIRLEWVNAVLDLERGSGEIHATHEGLKAYLKRNDVEGVVAAELLSRLKERNRRKPVTATVIVLARGTDRKIVEIHTQESKPT